MNTEYLVEFIRLAQCSNFTEAASMLHIAQSTLSKHIANLEAEFDAKFFIRQHEGARLTEEGYLFFGIATSIVDSIDEAKRRLTAMQSSEKIVVYGQLQDSGVSGILSTAIMLNNEGGQIPIVLRHPRFGDDYFGLLDCGEIDILVIGEAEQRLHELPYAYCHLMESRFVAVVDSTHPLAGRDSITISELRSETLLEFVDAYSKPGWRSIEAVCQAHGFKPKTRPILSQSVSEQLATPLSGCVLIFPATIKELRYLSGSQKRACIPIDDDDAKFSTWGIYQQSNEERVMLFLLALKEVANQQLAAFSSRE